MREADEDHADYGRARRTGQADQDKKSNGAQKGGNNGTDIIIGAEIVVNLTMLDTKCPAYFKFKLKNWQGNKPDPKPTATVAVTQTEVKQDQSGKDPGSQ